MFKSPGREEAVDIGERLCLLRHNTNQSQRDVARELGVHWRTYQTWEVGYRLPKIQALLKIADLHDVSPQWLATGEGPSHTQRWVVSELSKAAAILHIELEGSSKDNHKFDNILDCCRELIERDQPISEDDVKRFVKLAQ